MKKEKIEDIEVEESSGNVFEDLGLPDAKERYTKVLLSIMIAIAGSALWFFCRRHFDWFAACLCLASIRRDGDTALFCWARAASSSCSRCLMASGEEVVVCGVDSATCAAAGKRLIPAKPADNSATESETRAEVGEPPRTVSG